MRFQSYLTEEALSKYIIETLIQLKSDDSNYGNIIILAGGAASGKGFSVKNFLEGSKFKVRDVDEIKKLYMSLAKLKNVYPEIQNLKLTNPKHVNKLHLFVAKKKIKDKTLDLLLKDVKGGRLPNIIFDNTLRKPSKVDFIKGLVEAGYNPKNINLVWVLTNYQIAVKQNRNPTRDRIVPEDVLLQTHEGAALSMVQIIKSDAKSIVSNKKYFDGGIYVILGGKKHNIVWRDKKGDPITTKVDSEMMKRLGFTSKEKLERKPEPIIKDFKYLQVKEQGKSITTDTGVLEKLHKWIISNIPRTLSTKGIWKEADR